MIDYEKLNRYKWCMAVTLFLMQNLSNLYETTYEIAISGDFTSFTVFTFSKQRQQPDCKIDLYHIT